MFQHNLQKAVKILRLGGLVAFPTETVYGLGGDAANPVALKKIFAAKGRPIDHPLIVHIADKNQLPLWAQEISNTALQLAETFWPGPLTLILKKKAQVSDLITGNQETIGLRVPNHPLAQALLEAFGSGLAGPSANRFGRISPTSAAAVYEELGKRVDFILDGGPCLVGVESTIVDVTREKAVILRPGMITFDEIAACVPVSRMAIEAPRVPGALASHYAPKTKMKLVESAAAIVNEDLPCVFLTREQKVTVNSQVECVVMPEGAREYARVLYQNLREWDKREFRSIVVEKVPEGEEWSAIRDRLRRACGSS